MDNATPFLQDINSWPGQHRIFIENRGANGFTQPSKTVVEEKESGILER